MKTDIINELNLPDEVAEKVEFILDSYYYPTETGEPSDRDFFRMLFFFPEEARMTFGRTFGTVLLERFLKGNDDFDLENGWGGLIDAEEFSCLTQKAYEDQRLIEAENLGLIGCVEDGSGNRVYGVASTFVERAIKLRFMLANVTEFLDDPRNSSVMESAMEIVLEEVRMLVMDDGSPLWKHKAYLEFSAEFQKAYQTLMAMMKFHQHTQSEYVQMFSDFKSIHGLADGIFDNSAEKESA